MSKLENYSDLFDRCSDKVVVRTFQPFHKSMSITLITTELSSQFNFKFLSTATYHCIDIENGWQSFPNMELSTILQSDKAKLHPLNEMVLGSESGRSQSDVIHKIQEREGSWYENRDEGLNITMLLHLSRCHGMLSLESREDDAYLSLTHRLGGLIKKNLTEIRQAATVLKRI